MDEIYANVEHDKPVAPRPSPYRKGPSSSERRFHGAVVLCLGLLNVFQLAGLIGLAVHSADLSAIKANLTERLQASVNMSSSLTQERDLLNISLVEMTRDLNKLQKPSCPVGWRMFSCACYFLSNESGSWEKGREDCKTRGADLVVINSSEEQKFLSNFTKEEIMAWIGLTDRIKEGTWMWINGAPLSLQPFQYWRSGQPDNNGGHRSLGEEDCAHIIYGGEENNWNDLSCETDMRWICEKMV
ncbi:CD209 antigen-like protein E isoform X2 [Micropterus dolomieu]|uniref:CD209 antigen-like protein E isoform X2 n=1 Tax=Micropterus dolomieu TaxID=147949 RepID=UPI001E8E63CF|nr:CD209 antigen-like protein E isoform X2 [Micropterus dolomieu]